MPKIKESKFANHRRIISTYGKDYFKTDGDVLMCKVCVKIVCTDKKAR